MVTKRSSTRRIATKRGSTRPSGARSRTAPKPKPGETAHEYLIRLGKSLPEELLATLPDDLAVNWHHYAHGAPKAEP